MSRSDAENAAGENSTRSPLERLLDIGVYAPIGLLANRDDVVGELADRGRKQVAFSRSLGRAALKAIRAGARSNPSTHRDAASGGSAVAGGSAAAGEIADYASLTAREVIALIPSCSLEQRLWIAKAEQDGKARITVLRALDRN